MPKPQVSPEIREKMFEHWHECHNVMKTARLSGVSEHSVRKYMKIDKWKEREKGITQQVQEMSDFDRAGNDAKRLKIFRSVIDAGLNDWVTRLEEARETAREVAKETGNPIRVKMAIEPLELERFIKLEKVVAGTDQADGGSVGDRIEHKELSPDAKAGLQFLEKHGRDFIKDFADTASREARRRDRGTSHI